MSLWLMEKPIGVWSWRSAVPSSSGFVVLRTADVVSRGLEQQKANALVDDFAFWAAVPTATSPSHVALSSDELTLAVCVVKSGAIFAQMYDARAFADQVAATRRATCHQRSMNQYYLKYWSLNKVL